MAPSPAALAAFYFTNFAVLGIYLPYLNLYLESLGLDGRQIGILAAAIPLGKVVFGPAWTLAADRVGSRKGIAVAATGMATLAFSAALGTTSFWGLCGVLYLYAALLSPQLPLVEATTLDLADRHRWQYGRIRVWGSLGFIVTSLALGPFFDAHPIRLVIPVLLAAMVANFAATAAIPAVRPRITWRRGDLSAKLLRGEVLVFFACTLLMQASHGAYYAFFSILLEDAGFRRGTIGGLWVIGVVAEMATMIGAAGLLQRFGTARMMTVCLALAVARWGVTATTTWLPALALVQVLHAFTFGAFHVAGVTGTHRLFPEPLRSSGQSLYSGLTYGAGSVVGFLGAGVLYEAGGAVPLFLVMAGMAGAALAASLLLWRSAALRPAAAAARGGRS